MGRYLIALSLLLSTINTAKQHMFKALKLPYKQLMYASLAIAMLSLSGCATMGQLGRDIDEVNRGSRNVWLDSPNYTTQGTTCSSYVYGNSISTTCN